MPQQWLQCQARGKAEPAARMGFCEGVRGATIRPRGLLSPRGRPYCKSPRIGPFTHNLDPYPPDANGPFPVHPQQWQCQARGILSQLHEWGSSRGAAGVALEGCETHAPAEAAVPS